jgi:UDP-GlcNAc3NAcA epimerase
MKLVTVIGARPQFIKAAAVSKAIAKIGGVAEVLLHTGQHYDQNMSHVFFEELGIPVPKYNLGVGGGLHGAMTGAQLVGIEDVLVEEKPEYVLVYGDTNSTLAGALAAAKLHIPVVHVEAGLRSFNRRMPEEINRIVTDHVSDILFAPTVAAMRHLANEGIEATRCHQIGDVMYDAALVFCERARASSTILKKLGVEARHFVLATIHRAENTDDLSRLKVILGGFRKIAEKMLVVWPIHPRTRKILGQEGVKDLLGDRVLLIDPVGYLDMVMLEQSAALIATDSGGVQKEAFFYRVPCVTLRDETEWVELVESGWNRLVSPVNVDALVCTALQAIGSEGSDIAPYGDGKASERIVEVLAL